MAFQEFHLNLSPASEPGPAPMFDCAFSWVVGAFRRAGIELRMGLKLYQTFLAAGLPAPCMQMDVHLLTPTDRLGSALAANTVRGALPYIETFGLASAEEVGIDTLEERLHAEVVARQAVVTEVALVGAWARKA